jgi:hypothetical protein
MELVGFQSEQGGEMRQVWINPRFVMEVREGAGEGAEVEVVLVGGRGFSVAEPLPAVLKMLRGKDA